MTAGEMRPELVACAMKYASFSTLGRGICAPADASVAPEPVGVAAPEMDGVCPLSRLPAEPGTVRPVCAGLSRRFAFCWKVEVSVWKGKLSVVILAHDDARQNNLI